MEYIARPFIPAIKIIPNHEAAPALTNETDTLSEKQYIDLYRQHYEELLRYAERFLSDPARSQDAVQEAFLRLWKRRSLTDARLHTRALLYKSVRNLCLNALRNDKTHERLLAFVPEPAASPDPEAAAHSTLILELVQQWVLEMPERRREVFELTRYANLSYKEVAEIMEISVKTVENHLVAALRYLRNKLHSYDPKLLQS